MAKSRCPAPPPDHHLLREYAITSSEDAFAELVRRYVNLVYSAALRQTGNPAAAEELTQVVFIICARKAGSLGDKTILSGWLFRTLRFAVLDAHKIEVRRQQREHEAAQMNELQSSDAETTWESISPFLDDALASLNAHDRHAVLLRFFEKKSFREIGAALGGNENSAQVRLGRALQKLRHYFRKRGVVVPVVALGSVLLARGVEAAPTTLCESVATAMSGGAALGVARAIEQRMAWRRAMLALLFICLFGGLFFCGVLAFRGWRSEAPVDTAAIARATHAVTVEIDRRFWRNEPEGLAAMIHYRNRAEEQTKPIIIDYVRAAAEFRDEFGKLFRSAPNRHRAYMLTLGELALGQPPATTPVLTNKRATDNSFQDFAIVLTNANGGWKWDLFSSLTPKLRAERMAALQRKTPVLQKLTLELHNGTLTNGDDVLRSFESERF